MPDESYYNPRSGDLFYLWGALSLLDHAREWCRSADGTLYLWTRDGSDPAGRLVEAKRRSTVFDVTDRAFITITNLAVTSRSIMPLKRGR